MSPICCLDPLVEETVQHRNINWTELLEQEPDAGLGEWVGGLGRLAACFMESAVPLSNFPPWATAFDMSTVDFRKVRASGMAGKRSGRDKFGCARQDPWEVPRPTERVEVGLNCSFELHGGSLRTIPGQPSTLYGIPFDRPVVGYGGKTINTLRLWAAAAPDYFDFQRFSGGDFIGALAETLSAESLTRVLYPDDSTTMGQCLRFVQEYFLAACSLSDDSAALPAQQ